VLDMNAHLCSDHVTLCSAFCSVTPDGLARIGWKEGATVAVTKGSPQQTQINKSTGFRTRVSRSINSYTVDTCLFIKYMKSSAISNRCHQSVTSLSIHASHWPFPQAQCCCCQKLHCGTAVQPHMMIQRNYHEPLAMMQRVLAVINQKGCWQ
jgi:hypothetical protein